MSEAGIGLQSIAVGKPLHDGRGASPESRQARAAP